ncbi:TPA: lpg2874 family Dot/Icm T4SS effector [Legionella pneumophila subsp. pneumophila]|uniref:Uncharacterized protein n=1 Tax=Legionella pneumophila (strain Lens) TaxID=297245 RepID=Q5WST9_LEGPL|nr:lpg2874 family Dot/Icm T4SS effector [Legionella pneumophila]AOW53386.1 hypothetical protein BE841_13430 [Legionella pneumophila subsp. pneumophila]AOW55716.1 hypothetical protein BE842_10205 [Legionella pneumophila subsp. pneumophila]AOW58723.1 hypothetical protein BE843_10885 [Legionella pneumophila subsp. pneumophila]AOW61090.1 hypothetical protein BE844_07880 [Legionella pneumophila subsp. pneumophila]AOW64185.1 hypothetical protein BE845_09005 [Legionella pneumophila subsp. pneumophila
MNIFLKVLKKLMKEKLSELSANLKWKSETIGYNTKLSIDQKNVIDKLEESIVLFKDSGNDEADLLSINALIDTARIQIHSIRESYGEPRDKGESVTCLNNLKNHSNDFLGKLKKFDFDLLNKAYTETPENIVYYHAAIYLGDEIFSPRTGIDYEIRTKKEVQLAVRLQALSERINPSHNLEEQRKRALQVLQDLAQDNQNAIKKDKGFSLPGLSFWGVSVVTPSDWFSSGEGRFGVEFNTAVRTIQGMTESQFERPTVKQTTAKQEETKPSDVKKTEATDEEDEEHSSENTHTL